MALQQRFAATPHNPAIGLSPFSGDEQTQYGLVTPLNNDTAREMKRIFHQLMQALEVLRNLGHLLGGEQRERARPALQRWLQPNARAAEQAMHDLRGLRLIKSPALTDLSQSLTVLVLAADMLAEGHLSGADTLAFSDLLKRNTLGALDALDMLREQCRVEA